MQYDLTTFNKLVDEGYIRRVENGNLVLYDYTDKCTYEKHWNEYTRMARGIIFEKDTGLLIAKPFDKFFNLGEMPETQLSNLPAEGYIATEKVDGSMGTVYFYNNRWNVATRGSFNGRQALKAQELLKKYDMSKVPTEHTLIVEIIYPENKIVVNYGREEKLILLGVYNTAFGFEVSPVGTSVATGIPTPEWYNYTIELMIQFQKTLPKDQEGFVVRYDNGLRVKIKGQEYLRIHKIISNLSPLSAFESMENGKVPITYLEQIPEEYSKDFKIIVTELERQYAEISKQIEFDTQKLPTLGAAKEDLKAIGIYIAAPNELRHPSAIFPAVLKKQDALDRYIMKQIRPTNNALRLIV